MTPAATRPQKVLGWMRESLRDLRPYYKAPLEGEPLRLDQNTNLHGSNPCLAMVDLEDMDATQYPTRDADDLRQALADHHGLVAGNFLACNGSDEALDILTKGFTEPGQTLATPWPGYSLYPFYAKLQGLHFERVPLRGGFKLDVDAILATKPSMVVVASPNNPTGNRFPRSDLERLLAEVDGIVVVDEAYIEYAGGSIIQDIEAFDNLVIMRTFSKAHGLAALRIGYMAANEELAGRLRLVKPPFNLSIIAEQVAIRALADTTWADGVVADVLGERDRIAGRLKELGFQVFPSDANFLLCRSPVPPEQVVAGLRERGILCRHFPGAPMLGDHVRFTIGKPEHTDRLVAALREVLA